MLERSPAATSREPARWYDAQWLVKYVEAKAIIARVAPARLAEFTHSFDRLRIAPDFRPVPLPGFLADRLDELRQVVREIPRDALGTAELSGFGRFLVRRWPPFTALQHDLKDAVSELAGEALEPTYNFLSLYTRMGVCRPHLDAPSAKWTLDICLAQSDPWPIHFSRAIAWPETQAQLDRIDPDAIVADPALDFREALLEPGDAVLFSGTNQWHYRDAMPARPGRNFCDLLFLHYIPEGTAELTQPRAWAELFGIPELAAMADLDQVY